MPTVRALRRILLLVFLTVLAVPGGSAQAAVINPTFTSGFNYWRYDVAMGSGITALTIQATPGDGSRFRITESGDTLTVNTSSSGTPCTAAAGGGYDCVFSSFSAVAITNAGGSATPPLRDRVIARGTASGDPVATRAPLPVHVNSTGGLMEFWSSDSGSTFTGSDVAGGDAATPADLWHAGPNDLCIIACNLGAGADRYEGGGGDNRIDGGAGNDTLVGRTGNETLTGGTGDDTILPGGGKDSLSGGDDFDTISFDEAGRTAGINTTFATNTGGTIGSSPYDDSTIPLAPGTGDTYDNTFERLVATPQADVLTGGPGVDRLYGAGGDDVIRGAGGADVLDGGAGNDAVDYRDHAASAPVSVSLAAGTGGHAPTDGAGDTLARFERVFGTPGSDTLVGSGSDEAFDGGAGGDLIDGAGGTDTVSYAGRSEGVSVTVGASGADDGNAADGPPGARDELRQIENVEGTPLADVLVGDDSAGALVGGAGDDVLDGGGGPDRLDGGEGRDTASYASRGAGADVSLASGTGPDGDSLSGIEDLVGGTGDDRLTGDDGPNRLDGGPGNDVLTGLGGIDDFFGGPGNDGIFARDGLRETIECGTGRNSADIDPIDLTRDCDSDRDGDGIFDPADCAPDDASRRPGVPEIPGNKVDENCDGKVDPFPTVTGNPILTWSLLANGRTKIKTLRVERLQIGDQVSLTCKGTGCKKAATRKPTLVKKGTSVSLTKYVKDLKLAPKATLEVRVVRANAIGRVVAYTFKRRKDPEKLQRCLPPGQKKTQRC